MQNGGHLLGEVKESPRADRQLGGVSWDLVFALDRMDASGEMRTQQWQTGATVQEKPPGSLWKRLLMG